MEGKEESGGTNVVGMLRAYNNDNNNNYMENRKVVMDLGLGWAYLLGVHGITSIYFKKAMSEDQERHSP